MSRQPLPPTPFPGLRAALTGAVIAAVTALPAAAEEAAVAEAKIHDRDGDLVGNALLHETPAGVLLHVNFSGLPPGVHGFHIHETGKCEPPFKSAGGHLTAPDTSHGYLTENGPHLGDMPNIHVPKTGALQLEVMTEVAEMDEQLLDADGAALVLHANADDYRSQPSGAAGPRIACGVIEEQVE